MRALWTYISGLVAVACVGGVPEVVVADEGIVPPVGDAASDEEVIDEIIVTGSRIRRSTYTSIAPLQVITSEVAKAAGLFDVAEVLHDSIAATGPQAGPAGTAGWILSNGPGSSWISLRGLGDARTLVMINGRRVAPAGVEGAPVSADLTLIPSSLVQRYEVLLDGASSVYGSDAVAGVSNIILRRDFDGFEVEMHSSSPEQSGGLRNGLSIAWGKNFKNGFVGAGANYQNGQSATFGDRRWTSGCTRHVEEDQNGNIRHDDLFAQFYQGQPLSGCIEALLPIGRIVIPYLGIPWAGGFDPGPGSVYYTPGFTNTGVPDFSDTHWLLPGGLDGNGDGVQDVLFRDYTLDQLYGDRQLYPDFERLSLMAYGEHTFAGDAGLTPFFEIQYASRDVRVETEGFQFFPLVPATNPFNPCNPDGLNGVDCAVAWNYFYTQQTIIDATIEEVGVPPSALGLGNSGPVGALPVQSVVVVRGDRSTSDVELSQTRGVIGIRGNLPALDKGSLRDWNFEVALVGSRSFGTSQRPGVRIDWLNESLETSAVDPTTGSVVCGVDTTGDGVPDGLTANGRSCVPVNMFAPSLYAGRGDFATTAERNFLFDTRDFETEYKQWFVTGLVRGDVFELPGGTASAVLGVEYREDEVRSIPDEVARDALFFGFFTDGGAIGKKYVRELFAEIELPLLKGAAAAEELVLNASARYTEDQYYGSDTTYAGRLGWRPVDSLFLRATIGTSFRAPNLNEIFRVDPGGNPWTWIRDPCISLPDEEIEPDVMRNCVESGVDPSVPVNDGWPWYETDVTGGGNKKLTAETSESYSYGFVWQQPFSTAFDLSISASYYNIDVADSITHPDAFYVTDSCYGAREPNNVLCERIVRDPQTQAITSISVAYLNRDHLLVSGYDVNVSFAKPVTAFGKELVFSAALAMNHPEEVSESYSDDVGNTSYEDSAGEWGYPDWHGNLSLGISMRDYWFSWRTRFIGAVDVDPEEKPEWNDIFFPPDETWNHSDTCGGPTLGDVLCRDVSYADDYFVHTASLFFNGEAWSIGGGIRNVFDTAPPLVSHRLRGSFRNAPNFYGYDLNGRTYFLNIAARFN